MVVPSSYGLIGRNGCGKTILLKTLAAKRFPGLNSTALRIAYVAQEELETLACSVLDRIISGDERITALQQNLERLEDCETALSADEVKSMESILEQVSVKAFII